MTLEFKQGRIDREARKQLLGASIGQGSLYFMSGGMLAFEIDLTDKYNFVIIV